MTRPAASSASLIGRPSDRSALCALHGLRACRRQRPPGLEQALETGQRHGPAIADCRVYLAAALELVVRHRELDLAADGLDLERHARGLLAPEYLVELDVSAVAEPPVGLISEDAP